MCKLNDRVAHAVSGDESVVSMAGDAEEAEVEEGVAKVRFIAVTSQWSKIGFMLADRASRKCKFDTLLSEITTQLPFRPHDWSNMGKRWSNIHINRWWGILRSAWSMRGGKQS